MNIIRIILIHHKVKRKIKPKQYIYIYIYIYIYCFYLTSLLTLLHEYNYFISFLIFPIIPN